MLNGQYIAVCVCVRVLLGEINFEIKLVRNSSREMECDAIGSIDFHLEPIRNECFVEATCQWRMKSKSLVTLGGSESTQFAYCVRM